MSDEKWCPRCSSYDVRKVEVEGKWELDEDGESVQIDIEHWWCAECNYEWTDA